LWLRPRSSSHRLTRCRRRLGIGSTLLLRLVWLFLCCVGRLLGLRFHSFLGLGGFLLLFLSFSFGFTFVLSGSFQLKRRQGTSPQLMGQRVGRRKAHDGSHGIPTGGCRGAARKVATDRQDLLHFVHGRRNGANAFAHGGREVVAVVVAVVGLCQPGFHLFQCGGQRSFDFDQRLCLLQQSHAIRRHGDATE
jgi:hypothetical protein